MIKSKAFRRAALNSESYRTLGLLFVLGALLVVAVIRNLAAGAPALLRTQLLVLGLAIVYELARLWVLKKALSQGRDVHPLIWIFNVIIETQLPTIAFLLFIQSGLMEPYQALVAPAIMLYFLFIILSTLRLSASLSFL